MDDRLRVRVERTTFVADAVREFVLRPLSTPGLRAWRAGAHISVHARTMDGREAERRYSIVGCDGNAEHCIIAVHRVHDHGVAAWLRERVAQGDELDISQPVNDFGLPAAAPRTVLIAGGIGITPLLPMAREQLAAGQPFEIHYAARSLSAMAYRAEVQALGTDKAYLYAGGCGRRLDIAGLAARWRADDHLCVCGPRRMIGQVRANAAAVGIAAKQVHFESFGAAAAVHDRAFVVELRRSRRTLSVCAGQTILRAVEDAGIHTEADCLRGECGVCAVRVVEGDVDHRDLCLSHADRQASKLMTPCVSRAMGERLVLEM